MQDNADASQKTVPGDISTHSEIKVVLVGRKQSNRLKKPMRNLESQRDPGRFIWTVLFVLGGREEISEAAESAAAWPLGHDAEK